MTPRGDPSPLPLGVLLPALEPTVRPRRARAGRPTGRSRRAVPGPATVGPPVVEVGALDGAVREAPEVLDEPAAGIPDLVADAGPEPDPNPEPEASLPAPVDEMAAVTTAAVPEPEEPTGVEGSAEPAIPGAGTPEVAVPEAKTPGAGTAEVEGSAEPAIPGAGTPEVAVPEAKTPEAAPPRAGAPPRLSAVPDAPAPPAAGADRSPVDADDAERRHPWRTVARTAAWTSAILAVAVVLLVFVFPTRTYLNQRRQLSTAANQLRLLDQQNAQLSAQVARLQTDSEIERLAREQYHLVRPGERAFAILPAPSPAASATTPTPKPSSGLAQRLTGWIP